MTQIIERVARAICASGACVEQGSYYVDRYWHIWIPEARAAISAMSEPTEAMKRAADRLPDVMSVGDEWRAMIDEALKDTQ
jgi:hypothetical protein